MHRKASLLVAIFSTHLFAFSASQIDSLVRKEMETKKIPGVSLSVLGAGLSYSQGYGLADVENSVPAKPETVYRLASISKTMTSIAVMQLAETGKLDLDKPIQTYCPAFPVKQWPITARQLLGHLAGVRHYQGNEEENSNKEHFTDIVTPLSVFKNDPLLHEPGTVYAYTTYGFNVLGCAVEGASGEKFVDYVTKHIFEPAGMDKSRADNVLEIIPHRAQGYDWVGGVLQNSPLADTSNKIPGGGLASTVQDLIKYSVAIQAERLLSKQSLKLSFAPQTTKDGKMTDYGLGWRLGTRNGLKEVWHTGGQERVSNVFYMLPEKGFAIAILTNLQKSGPLELAREIADVWLAGR